MNHRKYFNVLLLETNFFEFMNKKYFSLAAISLSLASFALFSCSSNDDNGVNNPSSTTPPASSGTVPDNTDSGKNNLPEPDNVNNQKPGNDGDTSEWQLVFEDNFEGTDSIPNTQYWSLTPKGEDTWNRHMSESYGQAYQKDGYLYLFGMMANDEYLTGGIESRGKFDFTYGQVKCRARFLRQPQGNHTGIWMMPEPPAQKWPRSGEIDIMEHLDDQGKIFETAHFWNGTSTDEGKDDSSDTTVQIDNNEFNTYGVIWDKNSVTFTVNGEEKFSYSNNDPNAEDFSYQYPFTEPFYLILSQSLGGKGTWEGVIDNGQLPSIFQIDWIKVWQKTE